LAFGGLCLRKYNKQGVGDYPAVVIKSIGRSTHLLFCFSSETNLKQKETFHQDSGKEE
jgi:hypothetical protein